MEEIVLISGSQLVYGGREIINYPKRLRWAYVRRVGNRMFVQTDDGEFSVNLPKKTRSNASVLRPENVSDAVEFGSER